MARRAFVHIGTHKTGSTYLQNWLRLNRRALRRLGLEYPKIGLWDYGADHQALSLQARRTKGRLSDAPDWARLRAFLKTSDRDVIISAETLSEKIDKACVAGKVVEFFKQHGIETTFVIYLRDIPAYMNSRYVQEARSLKHAQSFDSYVQKAMGKRDFDYPRLLEPFEQVAEMRVLGYRPRGEPLEQQFLSALGHVLDKAESGAFKGVARLNTSVGPASIEIARRIARQLPQNIAPAELKYKQLVFRNLCAKSGLNHQPFVGCDQATADKIRSLFAAQTDMIAERYFSTRWSDTVPAEDMFERHSVYAPEHDDNPTALDDIVNRVLSAKPGFEGPIVHSLKVLARRVKW
jgi:hypothetical protein